MESDCIHKAQQTASHDKPVVNEWDVPLSVGGYDSGYEKEGSHDNVFNDNSHDHLIFPG